MSPAYDYKCPECGKIDEIIHPIRFINIGAGYECGKCEVQMKRLISRTGKPQVVDYYSENANAHFTGPKQKARILKEKGLTEAGDIKLEDFKHG